MVDSEDRYSTEKASSVQSAILYDCDTEALSNSIRPSQSYSVMVKWRCCPELVQNHGFRSVEVLLDTPPGSPKNCPEARGGSVQVQIRLSRPVSFFVVKPRLCPRQDQFNQSSPVQSRRPLGFGQVLSDQPAASCLEHCELVPVIFKDSFIAGGWTIWITGLRPYRPEYCDPKDCGLSRGDPKDCGPRSEDRILPIERMNPKSPFPGVVGLWNPRVSVTPIYGVTSSDVKSKSGLGTGLGLMCISLVFPLLEARSWQEAKSNLVTIFLTLAFIAC
ncbi:unnamed protein product [Brassica rapa]|uniref:Uncharacterized protein n=1 Tax=Brassica campestris TaxID=3711 RepID=A0A8D9CVF1_BRACM|nr:unnamed protein product [Brassica rapa]